MSDNQIIYDCAVIGGGASGTALLYTLAKYTNLSSLVLIEKNNGFGLVNSDSKNNSQTLHVGDIETNYSMEKVRQVKPAAMMVKQYTDTLEPAAREDVIAAMQKMILAVGNGEVAELEKRFEALRELFPGNELVRGQAIAAFEPTIMEGRDPNIPIAAIVNHEGYSVNFQKLSESFITQTKKITGKKIDILLERKVIRPIKNADTTYALETDNGPIIARTVVFDTDAYSLTFAKMLGLGHEFSLIPIAGTFYFTKQHLRGKVYTMQDQRLPFAAVHGDPDFNAPGKTRWGPTARFFPVLESRHYATIPDYFRSSGLGKWQTWKSFFKILLDPVRFRYLAKNIVYDLPFIGKLFFVKNIKKIVPTVSGLELRIARGYGGMRLQRVDIGKQELLLGEGKIIGDNIIFNMSPSPGASVCLFNAMRDSEQLMQFFGGEFSFDKAQMLRELSPETIAIKPDDVSAKHGYAS